MNNQYQIANYSIDSDIVEQVRRGELTTNQAKAEMKKRMQNLHGGKAEASSHSKPTENKINATSRKSDSTVVNQKTEVELVEAIAAAANKNRSAVSNQSKPDTMNQQSSQHSSTDESRIVDKIAEEANKFRSM